MIARYVLDTDTCVYWLNGDAGIERRVTESGMDGIAVTAITLCELYYGAFKSDRRKANLEVVDALSKKLSVLAAERKAAPIFGQLKAELEKAGRPLDDADLLIGSIALAHGAVLVTNNVSHFSRVPNLTVETWRET